MCKINLHRNVCLVATKSCQYRKLDYYLVLPNGQWFYGFTRDYSTTCYELCRSKISVDKVIRCKRNNKAIMNLVKYVKRMVPYLIQYYGVEKEAFAA